MKEPQLEPRPQIDCRFFSGYKPCEKNAICSSSCQFKKRASPHILVIHLEALGAVLRATAILPALKRKWPAAHVTWVTSPAAAALLQNNPLIDRILKNDHDGVLNLSALGFDLAFSIDKSLTAAGLLKTPQYIKETRGFGVDPQSGAIIPLNPEAQRLWELGLSNFEKFEINRLTETRLLTEALGLDFRRDGYVFQFTHDEIEFQREEKKRLGIKRARLGETQAPMVIGLNTGCSPTIPYKKLSVDGWQILIRKLHKEKPRAHLLLLGGPEDTKRNQEIAAGLIGIDVIQTPTERGLRVGMCYVNLCDTVVTGDSLGMHMAIALKKWTVAWFGPTCAHEIDFYDRGRAILSKAPCGPCWKRQCDKPLMCYDLVDFAEIVKAVKAAKSARKAYSKGSSAEAPALLHSTAEI